MLVKTSRRLVNVKLYISDYYLFINFNSIYLMNKERVKIEGTSGEVQLQRLKLDFPYLVLVKLIQGDILKDEMIMALSWKKF